MHWPKGSTGSLTSRGARHWTAGEHSQELGEFGKIENKVAAPTQLAWRLRPAWYCGVLSAQYGILARAQQVGHR